MEKAVIEKVFGKVFVKRRLFIEVVEKGNVDASGGFHAVANGTEYSQVNLFLG